MVTEMQEHNSVDMNQIVSLAKRHARTMAGGVFTIVFSFVMALVYLSSSMSGNGVPSTTWIAGVFCGLVAGGVVYTLIYAQQGLSTTNEALTILFGVVSREPQAPPHTQAHAPVNVLDYIQEPIPAEPVSIVQKIKGAVDWYEDIDWVGLCEHVLYGGGFSKRALEHFVPIRIYIRFGDNPTEVTFPEAMVDLGLAAKTDTGHEWTEMASIYLGLMLDELEGGDEDPPTPAFNTSWVMEPAGNEGDVTT
jgi:hypothetical protein